jgi:general secretion pathway protein E
VRVLCERCKIPETPDASTLSRIGLTAEKVGERPLYRACGCPECLHTGSRGRMGIFEIMVLDERIKHRVLDTYDANLIKKEALAEGMATLRHDGIRKVLEGTTTIEEVLRVTQA